MHVLHYTGLAKLIGSIFLLNEVQCCPKSQLKCNNNLCIDAGKWCDNTFDCTDSSDELNCSSATTCPEGQLRCPDASCVAAIDDCSSHKTTNVTQGADKQWILILCVLLAIGIGVAVVIVVLVLRLRSNKQRSSKVSDAKSYDKSPHINNTDVTSNLPNKEGMNIKGHHDPFIAHTVMHPV